MEFIQLTRKLEGYDTELGRIFEAFKHSGSSLMLNEADDAKYRQIILELEDLLLDVMPNEGYAERIKAHFFEGLNNFLQSPSKASVQDVQIQVSAILTRLRRLGEVPVAKSGSEVESKPMLSDLPYPDRITLAWLWHNVPVSMWWVALGILVLAFSTGMGAGALLVQENGNPAIEQRETEP